MPLGRDSSVATGWTVRGSNPSGGWEFPHQSSRPWGLPSFLYNEYRVFPGDKAVGSYRWPPTL